MSRQLTMHQSLVSIAEQTSTTRASLRSRRGNAAVAVVGVIVLALAAAAALFLFLGAGEVKRAILPTGAGSVSTARPVDGAELEGGETRLGGHDLERAPLLANQADKKQGDDLGAVADLAGSARLVGRVIDDLGRPVAGAEVGLDKGLPFFAQRTGKGQREQTDREGRFAFERATVGDGALTISAAGFATRKRSELSFAAGGVYDVGDIALERSVLLSGHVVDPRGRGIEGVELSSQSRSERSDIDIIAFGRGSQTKLAVSGPDGSFTIDTLPAGPWNITAEHDDHPTRKFEGTTTRPGESVRDLRFEIPDGASIAGRVVGMDRRPGTYSVSANAVGSGSIMMIGPGGFGMDARTVDVDAAGAFVVKGLELDKDYELVALRGERTSPGAMFFGGSERARASESVRARSGTLDARIEVLASARLRLAVVDALSSEPVEEYTVHYGSPWAPQKLDSVDQDSANHHTGGVAEFGDLPLIQNTPFDGGQVVRVEAEGYITYQGPIEVPSPGQLLDLGRVALTRAPMARIVVMGPLGPVAGAQVSIGRVTERGFETQGEGGTFSFAVTASSPAGDIGEEEFVQGDGRQARSRTNEKGEVSVTLPVENGQVELRVEHGDFAPFVAQADLTVGQDLVYTVILGPGGSAVVRVEDSSDAPLPWVAVEHRAPGDRGFMGGDMPKTDGEGRVRFDHLAPGTHRFRTSSRASGGMFAFSSDSDRSSEWTEVEIDHGVTREIVLRHEVGVRVLGIVREDGVPLPAARVALEKRRQEKLGGVQSAPAIMMTATDDGDAGSFFGFGGGGQSARTDGDGQYVIEGVQPGEYELKVTHPSRAAPTRVDVVVTASGDVVRDVDLTRNGVRGIVRNEQNEPVPGLSVRAVRSGGNGTQDVFTSMIVASGSGGASIGLGGDRASTATTDADGRYELVGLPTDAEFTVVVAAAGGAPYTMETSSKPLSVKEGEWKEGIDIVVKMGGAIEVTASKATMEELTFATVMAVPLDAAGNEVQGSNEFGFIEERSTQMKGLAPGIWRVTVQGMDSENPKTRDVTVRPGELTSIEF